MRSVYVCCIGSVVVLMAGFCCLASYTAGRISSTGSHEAMHIPANKIDVRGNVS